MIPPSVDPTWARLIKGELQYSLKSVPAGLMLSRLKREVGASKDPAILRKCIDEAFGFFEKYESILHEDIAQVFGKGA